MWLTHKRVMRKREREKGRDRERNERERDAGGELLSTCGLSHLSGLGSLHCACGWGLWLLHPACLSPWWWLLSLLSICWNCRKLTRFFLSCALYCNARCYLMSDKTVSTGRFCTFPELTSIAWSLGSGARTITKGLPAWAYVYVWDLVLNSEEDVQNRIPVSQALNL